MSGFAASLGSGAVAGAVGTTALNAATYLDMTVRGRPSSSTPENTVERAADLIDVSVPGDADARQARISGLGPLLGAVTGVGAGVVLGAMRGVGWPRNRMSTLATAWVRGMVAGNGPMAVLGVTDPRKWSAASWLADIVPHAAYALTATAALDFLDT